MQDYIYIIIIRQNISTMSNKTCSKCSLTKPLTEFYQVKSGTRSKYLSRCKACQIQTANRKYQRKPRGLSALDSTKKAELVQMINDNTLTCREIASALELPYTSVVH